MLVEDLAEGRRAWHLSKTCIGKKNEPLSEDEESWDSNWAGREWDMNLLEPLVEISDNPQDKGRKRRRPDSGESRKRTRLPSVNQAHEGENHVSTVTGSELVNVSVKVEPGETVPEPVEHMPCTVTMASMLVGNSSSTQPLPLYKMPSGNVVFLSQPPAVMMENPGNYSDQNANMLISHQQSRNSTSKKPNEEINLVANVKQEEGMENVFVMPFGGNLENEDKAASEKQPSPQPEISECQWEKETTRKNRTAAIAASLGVVGTSSSREVRELTFKLVELNNKNLLCDSRIEQIKDEFKKRLKIVASKKEGIENEIDRVVASIQDCRD
ncbi:hypothetical protein GWK47_013140 [Chionoecetes opilio]|uniref:Uncharacterized protein n=1 Tax=Chionoecetes opilio TaxID=41210 RepID=A0A8J4XVP3_CHIOP|nr:hypothetical protein GWK47_013140 [Chionoecetes opilio]